MQQWDVISVGDTATDVFIRLLEGKTKTIEDASGRWLVFPFGEKLPSGGLHRISSSSENINAA